MANKIEKDPEIQIENALGRTELWFEKNWKILTSIVAAVLVVAAGVYAYEGLYKIPRGKKAADAMFAAEQLFANEDYYTALNGSGNNLGFADIADSYAGTPQGRLAAHYAGVCYLKTGDAELAMTYLSKYKPTRGVPNKIINAQNEGLKGDISVGRVDYAGAVKHFRKAVKTHNHAYDIYARAERPKPKGHTPDTADTVGADGSDKKPQRGGKKGFPYIFSGKRADNGQSRQCDKQHF